MCKLRDHELLSWILQQVQAHRLCIFKLLLQQLNDHQVLEGLSSLIILSLCEGKLLKDLTRDSHKQQYEQPLKRG